MNWSARFLNPNSIEHVWNELSRTTAQRNYNSRTQQELKPNLLEEWALVPLTFIETLIYNMKARCEIHVV